VKLASARWTPVVTTIGIVPVSISPELTRLLQRDRVHPSHPLLQEPILGLKPAFMGARTRS
jgi:hypothetical protein